MPYKMNSRSSRMGPALSGSPRITRECGSDLNRSEPQLLMNRFDEGHLCPGYPCTLPADSEISIYGAPEP
jgi:hypothetical protein